MIEVLKYLKGHGRAVIIIFVLLVIQVMCDLALPQYTSDLVDVGIQQSGVEDNVPDYITDDTKKKIELFLDDKEVKELDNAYVKSTEYDNVLRFDGENREEINDMLRLPLAVLYYIEQSSEYDIEGMLDAVQEGIISKEDMTSQIEEKMSDYEGDGYSESLLGQAAVAFIGEEYERAGIDVDEIQMKYLWHKAFLMFIVTLVMMGTAIGVSYLASKTAAQIGRDTRKAIFSKVLSFGYGEMDRFSTASLITRSTNDIQQIQIVTVLLLRMVSYAPVMGIGACIKVAMTKTGMGWITAVAVILILLIIGCLVMIAMPKFKMMQTLIDRVNLVSREIITGIPVIRAFSRENHEKKRFNEASYNLMKTQVFTHRTMAFMGPSMMLIMNGISVLIVWMGSKGVDAGEMQVGDMMAFITYTMMIVASFMMLAMVAVFTPRAAVAAGRIKEVLETEVSVCDKDEALELKDIEGVIKFENVSFKYPEALDNVIENISFTAKPGMTTAIIGSTGCGKSTLINLIPRFYDVTEGKITVDDIDIREIKQADLRANIGFVPQKGVLFSGDIESNIKFAGEVSDERMISAAKMAQVDNFIESLPEKYQNKVAQGGSNVSGGQKQRLAIARAIAKNPKILIFDDSFSALDYKTDARLRKELSEKINDATVIIVAQRIATISRADQIIVLEDGKIQGIGTHSELLESCDTYIEIATSQLSEDELAKGGK